MKRNESSFGGIDEKITCQEYTPDWSQSKVFLVLSDFVIFLAIFCLYPTSTSNTAGKKIKIKSHYLLQRPSSVVEGRQVQANNYQIWNNTMPINNKSKKLKNP